MIEYDGYWIPISERLPEIGERVLVTVEREFNETLVDITTYGKHGFYISTVTAWIPMPKPYKGINVGDEVTDINENCLNLKYVVVGIDNGCAIMVSQSGHTVTRHIENLNKTGRNFPQIDVVLKELRGEI